MQNLLYTNCRWRDLSTISRCVGIGRRGRLKICLWQRSAGSSPATGIFDKNLNVKENPGKP